MKMSSQCRRCRKNNTKNVRNVELKKGRNFECTRRTYKMYEVHASALSSRALSLRPVNAIFFSLRATRRAERTTSTFTLLYESQKSDFDVCIADPICTKYLSTTRSVTHEFHDFSAAWCPVTLARNEWMTWRGFNFLFFLCSAFYFPYVSQWIFPCENTKPLE